MEYSRFVPKICMLPAMYLLQVVCADISKKKIMALATSSKKWFIICQLNMIFYFQGGRRCHQIDSRDGEIRRRIRFH